MKLKRLITFLITLTIFTNLFAQPVTTGTVDNIYSVGTNSYSYTYTDGFCTSKLCDPGGSQNPPKGQVVVYGDGVGSSYLFWNNALGNTGKILIPKTNVNDRFFISDMLVAYNGNTSVCYIVGSYAAYNAPGGFANPVLITAYWNTSTMTFVFVGPIQNIAASSSVNGWNPKIAQDNNCNFNIHLLLSWWQSNGTNGILMARTYGVTGASPFYIATSSQVNVYAGITGTSGYNFNGDNSLDISLNGANTCPSQGSLDPIPTFVIRLRNATTTIIETFQSAYTNLGVGTTSLIATATNTQNNLSSPSIATPCNYGASSYFNNYCVTYSSTNVSTGKIDIISRTKSNGILNLQRFLNHDYGENNCQHYTSIPKIAGGHYGYVVVWNHNDCTNLLNGGPFRMSILGRHLDQAGQDYLSSGPAYFIANNDFTFDKYQPSVSLSPLNNKDNIYLAFLYSDLDGDVQGPGTIINYYLTYKYLYGNGYKQLPSPTTYFTTNSNASGKKSEEIIIYPHSGSNGNMKIIFPENSGIVEIINIQGQVLFSKEVYNGNASDINVSNWSGSLGFIWFRGKNSYCRKVLF